jgi:asparagine synthase (glutamine-hydrolysing)
MCGLAGKLTFDGGDVSPALLRRMCDTLTSRGPDDEGYHVDGRVGLGHRRLAIIDLATGRQPIASEDRSVWVTLNGEIYNHAELRQDLVRRGHRFGTGTDTEVLVHLYEDRGEAFVHALRGMFALALWDARAQVLLLARDRVGKKPLYYCLLPGRGLVFASGIDALLADPEVARDLDPEALDAYLSLGYVPAPLTIYRAIRTLPAGHLLRSAAGGVAVREYWDLSFPAAQEAPDAAWSEELGARLVEAVGVRLRSDVPLGAFLSGGLDSSLVVALMAEALPRPVVTCTATFDDAAHDERGPARAVAERLGCAHHEYAVRADVADLPPRIAEAFDEPFADPAAIPNYLLAEAARRHVTVALTGDGGDELFAGYWRHARPRLEARLRRALGPAAPAVVPVVARRLASRRAGLLPLAMPPAQAYAWKHCGLVFDPLLKGDLYSAGLAAACRDFDPSLSFRRYYDRCPAPDPLGRALYVDFKTSLPDGILVKVDRTSMAHGLEVRSPLLDHTLAEFAARVPSALKLRHGRGKHLLAQAARSRLPRAVLDRPKHGLTTPIAQWLRTRWRELAEDCLLGRTARARGLFEPRAVESLWTAHLAGRDLYTQHLWTLIALELWHRRRPGGSAKGHPASSGPDPVRS